MLFFLYCKTLRQLETLQSLDGLAIKNKNILVKPSIMMYN